MTSSIFVLVRSDGLEPPTLCLLVGGVGIEPTQVKIFTLRPIVLPKADALPTELTSHKRTVLNQEAADLHIKLQFYKVCRILVQNWNMGDYQHSYKPEQACFHTRALSSLWLGMQDSNLRKCGSQSPVPYQLGESPIKLAAKPLEKILTFRLAAFGTTIISNKIWRLSFYCMHSICSNMFPLMKTKVSLKPKPHILSLLSRKVSNLSVKLLNNTKITNRVAVREQITTSSEKNYLRRVSHIIVLPFKILGVFLSGEYRNRTDDSCVQSRGFTSRLIPHIGCGKPHPGTFSTLVDRQFADSLLSACHLIVLWYLLL